MGAVTIRRAGADDAFVVAALQLQRARQQGMPPAPGYLDRFVDAWLGDRAARPTWIAQSRDEHAGLLTTRLVRELPLPGRADDRLVEVETLFAAPAHEPAKVQQALVEALLEWAVGLEHVRVRANATDEQQQSLYQGFGFVAVGRLFQLGPRDPS